MKYFIVGYDYDAICVCKTLADAEELVLSYAEEYQYEDYLIFNTVYSLYVSGQHLWIEEVGEY